MEIFQTTQNPWGQEVLVRISWSLFWVALAAGVGFCAVHLVLRRRWLGREEPAPETAAPAAVPAKVTRHGLAARLFHGIMALAMIVLLVTGFLPKVGLQFPWVTLHWVFGVVLIASIVFHMIHATFFLRLRDIWLGPRDVKELFQELRYGFGTAARKPPRPGKYPADHKLYHHAVTVAGFAAMITGVLMMFRIEQPFFARDPYLYSDAAWGWIYVLHGIGGVLLVTLTVTHIYFAILPEKRWITRSMIKGWITRGEYLEHHDPERWEVGETAEAEKAPAAKPAPERA